MLDKFIRNSQIIIYLDISTNNQALVQGDYENRCDWTGNPL